MSSRTGGGLLTLRGDRSSSPAGCADRHGSLQPLFGQSGTTQAVGWPPLELAGADTTHKLVVGDTELTEAVHDHFIKSSDV